MSLTSINGQEKAGFLAFGDIKKSEFDAIWHLIQTFDAEGERPAVLGASVLALEGHHLEVLVHEDDSDRGGLALSLVLWVGVVLLSHVEAAVEELWDADIQKVAFLGVGDFGEIDAEIFYEFCVF